MKIKNKKLVQVMDWRAAFWAGIINSVVFAVINFFVLPVILYTNSWVIIRLYASVFLGENILAPPATFDFQALIFGIASVFVFSMLFTMLIAFILHRWGLLVGILGGAVLGLSIYLINFYSVSYFFPWFFPLGSWSFVLTHIIFGAVAGGIYELLEVEKLVPED